MADEPDLRARLNERDGGLRRLKTLTGVLAVTMTALAGLFAGLAAQTAAGRKLIRVQPRTAGATEKPGASHKQATRIPPPPLPAAGSDSAPVPAAPAQPPAAAPAPAAPVVVSGGS
jgi:hypothetical protein